MSDESTDAMDDCARLKDDDLVREIKFLAEHARRGEVRLLAHLSEFDSRRLCLEEGYRSLFEYGVGALGFDEQESYRRLRAARVIRSYPAARAALESRKITVPGLVALAPWLTRDNAAQWLKAAEGKSRREIESLVAARYPQAPQPDAVRNHPDQPVVVPGTPPEALEAREAGGESPAVAAPDRLGWGWQQLTPVSIDRVRVGFDAASAVARLLERARQILRHKYPEGRLEDIVREALEAYLDRKDPQRRLELQSAKVESAPEPPPPEEDEKLPTRFLRAWAAGRYIPAKVKSEVWARDDGRCAWREKNGEVCGSRDWIEYDHVRPFAKGGRSDDPRNIRLLCRVHNQAAAEAAFDGRFVSEDGFLGFSAGPASA